MPRIKIIRTANLQYCDTLGDVTLRSGGRLVKRLGHINNMPRKLPIELMAEWSRIADLVEQDYIYSRD